MIQIPLYIFILIFFGIACISLIIFYISYHHIHSTGTMRGGALFATLILGGMLIMVITGTILSLTGTNWSEPIQLGSPEWFKDMSLFPQ